MQKTRIGIAVGMMGCIMFLVAQYGGYMLALLLAGYILLCEENEWLRKAAVKAVMLMFAFSVLSTVIYFIPNVLSALVSVINLFGAHWYPEFVHNVASVISGFVNLLETVLFLGLAFKALNQGDIPVPAVDRFIEKHI